jgi:hypothetical protein
VNDETNELHSRATDIEQQVREESKKRAELARTVGLKDRE